MKTTVRPVVVTTDPLHPDTLRELQGMVQLEQVSPADATCFSTAMARAQALIVRSRLPEDVVDHAPRLRAILRHGAGVDLIPVDRASAAGVAVCNVPGVNAPTVAQYVLGQLVVLRRRLAQAEHCLREGRWAEGRAVGDLGEDPADGVLGIVGYGAVGQSVQRLATGFFGMQVLVATSRPAALPLGVEAASMADLFQRADAVVLCCPLNDATRGMVGSELLGRMRRDAILINVARGPVVVEQELIDALTGGRLGGAILDVHDTQPLPISHVLCTLPNVMLTPHIAGVSAGVLRKVGAVVLRDLRAVLDGRLPGNLVNAEHAGRIAQRWSALDAQDKQPQEGQT